MLALHLLSAPATLAQSAGDTTRGAADDRWPVAAWISAGIGPGFVSAATKNVVSEVLRANVSVGPLLFTYRKSDSGPFESGDGVQDGALLAGVRSGGRRLFAAAAIGYAEARPYHQCECSEGHDFAPRASGVAYDLTVHANLVIFGVAASLSGVTRASRANYYAFTLALEAGWFGP